MTKLGIQPEDMSECLYRIYLQCISSEDESLIMRIVNSQENKSTSESAHDFLVFNELSKLHERALRVKIGKMTQTQMSGSLVVRIDRPWFIDKEDGDCLGSSILVSNDHLQPETYVVSKKICEIDGICVFSLYNKENQQEENLVLTKKLKRC